MTFVYISNPRCLWLDALKFKSDHFKDIETMRSSPGKIWFTFKHSLSEAVFMTKSSLYVWSLGMEYVLMPSGDVYSGRDRIKESGHEQHNTCSLQW